MKKWFKFFFFFRDMSEKMHQNVNVSNFWHVEFE